MDGGKEELVGVISESGHGGKGVVVYWGELQGVFDGLGREVFLCEIAVV